MHLNAPLPTYKDDTARVHMLPEKQPAQTKRPWKFNTPGVEQTPKQTHTHTHMQPVYVFLGERDFHLQPLKF